MWQYWQADTNYYPLIFSKVSELADNSADARHELYGRARFVLAEKLRGQKSLKRELRSLEAAINSVEKSPRAILATRGSTALLILSVFFPRLWLIDVTGISLFWIVRPWYRSLTKGRLLEKKHYGLLDGGEMPSQRAMATAKDYVENGRHRFASGVLCGGILIGAVWAVFVWNNRAAERTPYEAVAYDHCLADNRSAATCDAVVRLIRRQGL